MITWRSFRSESTEETGSMDADEFERVMLKLLLHRPTALPRFEELSDSRGFPTDDRVVFQRICAQARAEQPSLESSP